MKLKLHWSDFYKQMKKMKLEGEYQAFEQVLVDMFKSKFGCNVEIDWQD